MYNNTANYLDAGSNFITSPRLFAAHDPYTVLPESVKTMKCRIIYLCRNPKDVFVSMWHFGNAIYSEKLPLEEAFDRFCRGVAWLGPIWEHALDYWKLSIEKPEEVLFLKFEDLKDDITSGLKRMAEHLGCPFSVKEENEGVIEEMAKMCSFGNLSNLDVNKNTGQASVDTIENKHFFRKGGVGDWKNVLTPLMAQHFDQLMEEKLRGSGLTFS